MWVIEVENFGPFIVESDRQGNSLFERENAKIAANIDAAYDGTKPAVLKRLVKLMIARMNLTVRWSGRRLQIHNQVTRRCLKATSPTSIL